MYLEVISRRCRYVVGCAVFASHFRPVCRVSAIFLCKAVCAGQGFAGSCSENRFTFAGECLGRLLFAG